MMLPPQRMRVGEVIETRKDFKSQVILTMIENLQLGSSALQTLLACIIL